MAASAHIPSATNCSLDEILQELDLFLPAQFYGQRRHKFTGEATVLCGFGFLHSVPQGFSILPLAWGGGWQKNLPPPKPLFAGVVMLYPVILVEHPGTAQIGRSSHSGASGSTADYFGLQMINRHIHHPFRRATVKRSSPSSVPDCQQVVVKSTCSPAGVERIVPPPDLCYQGFAGGRLSRQWRMGWQYTTSMNRGFQNGNPCADCMGKAGSLAEMQLCPAAPQEPQSLGERTCPTNGRATTACFSRW